MELENWQSWTFDICYIFLAGPRVFLDLDQFLLLLLLSSSSLHSLSHIPTMDSMIIALFVLLMVCVLMGIAGCAQMLHMQKPVKESLTA